MYVDDFILCAQPEKIVDHRDQLINTLQELGWILNMEKSVLEPTNVMTYIGFEIVTSSGMWPTLWVATARVQKLRATIRRTLKAGRCSARQLARLLGQCVSMSIAVAYGKLMLRNAYNQLKSRSSWETEIILNEETITDLQWWLNEIKGERKHVIEKRPIDLTMSTDASQTGWGAYLEGESAAGVWNTRMSYEHSNYRELMGILLAIQTFEEKITGKTILLLTDNMTARAYLIHEGGPNKKFNILTKAIVNILTKINCKVQCNHLSGVLNIEADTLSRGKDSYNYALGSKWFATLQMIYGPHTIDRFADFENSKLPRYNALYADPRAVGVDALTQRDWGGENNYVFPPFRLIDRVLDIVEQQGAEATLIAPLWKAQTWFKRLLRMSVAEPLVIPNTSENFRRISRFCTPEPAKNRRWKVAAWRISGKKQYQVNAAGRQDRQNS